jgi:SAM-dependent methyltransferase
MIESKYFEKGLSHPSGDKAEHLENATASKHWESRTSDVGGYIELLNKIDLHPEGKKLLDVGCAAGDDVVEFYKNGIVAVGIDNNREFIAEAKNKHKNLEFVVGDAENLPFEDETYDLIYSTNTIFYTQLEKSIPEFCRVLKVHGRGIIGFDTEILDLDAAKVFHKDDVEHLKKILEGAGATLEYEGPQETRVDEEPFRHRHSFHKIVFRKL